VGSSRIRSAQRHCDNGLLRLGSRAWWAPSRHVRWRRANRAGGHPSLLRAGTSVVGVPPRLSAVPQKGCREVAVGRSGRHLRREKRRADLRLGRTDGVRGRLLSEPGLPFGRPRPPRVVRRGTRRHPSRTRSPVITSLVDNSIVRRRTELPLGARHLRTERAHRTSPDERRQLRPIGTSGPLKKDARDKCAN
jgi:hypothetical protein